MSEQNNSNGSLVLSLVGLGIAIYIIYTILTI